MSGSGDHFSDKLKRELKTAFALLSKSLQTDGIDLALKVDTVICSTNLMVDSFDQACAYDTPVIVQDGLEERHPYVTDAIVLLAPESTLNDISCQWQPVLVSEPVFSSSAVTLHKVGFENINSPQQACLDIPKVKADATVYSIPIPKTKTVAYLAPLQKMQKLRNWQQVDVTKFRQQSRPFPSELWKLPLRKAPIPPHRFTTEQKAKFRKALADKAYGGQSDIPQANIQLQVVYDRINLALFSSIDQDDRGYLVCYPKPDILENPQAFSKPLPSTYLVVGQRMDTKESIKALVPMEN